MPQMRLDKLLSHLNCGSRKEVQALIRAGRVSVDGTVQKDPAFKVDPDRSQTAVDGTVQRYRAQRYYMLNKPMGVITASRDERHDTVLELFPAELRRGLFAVGRLDKDTEGNPRDRTGAARACDAQRGQISSGQAHDCGSRRHGNGAKTPAAGWSLAG